MVEDDRSPRTAEAIGLVEYLRSLAPDQLGAGRRSGGLVRRMLKQVIPLSVRDRIRERRRIMQTDVITPLERRRAAKFSEVKPLRLHLGSMTFIKEGWVNIDLAGDPVDLRWNLAKPLPFPDGSIDAIFHEHLLEHLPLSSGLALLRDAHRMLAPAGVLRIGVPDGGAYLRSYYDGGRGVIEAVRPGRPTPMLALQEVFFGHGHRAMYDVETLIAFCREAGFVMVEKRAFGESRIEPCPDSEHRQAETLYVECVR